MDNLTIGGVAKQADVHSETLRYYERRGLVARPPRSVSPKELRSSSEVHASAAWEAPSFVGSNL